MIQTFRILKRIFKLFLKLLSPIKTFYGRFLESKLFTIIFFFLKFNLLSIGFLAVGWVILSTIGLQDQAEYISTLIEASIMRMQNILQVVAAYAAGLLLNWASKTKDITVENDTVEEKSTEIIPTNQPDTTTQDKIDLDRLLEILRLVPTNLEDEVSETNQEISRKDYTNQEPKTDNGYLSYLKSPYVLTGITVVLTAAVIYVNREQIGETLANGGVGNLLSFITATLFGRGPGGSAPDAEDSTPDVNEISLKDTRSGNKPPVHHVASSSKLDETPFPVIMESKAAEFQVKKILDALKSNGLNPGTPEATAFINNTLADPNLAGVKSKIEEILQLNTDKKDLFDKLPTPKSPPLSAEQINNISVEKSQWEMDKVVSKKDDTGNPIVRNGTISPIQLHGPTEKALSSETFSNLNTNDWDESGLPTLRPNTPESANDVGDENAKNIPAEALIEPFIRMRESVKNK